MKAHPRWRSLRNLLALAPTFSLWRHLQKLHVSPKPVPCVLRDLILGSNLARRSRGRGRRPSLLVPIFRPCSATLPAVERTRKELVVIEPPLDGEALRLGRNYGAYEMGTTTINVATGATADGEPESLRIGPYVDATVSMAIQRRGRLQVEISCRRTNKLGIDVEAMAVASTCRFPLGEAQN